MLSCPATGMTSISVTTGARIVELWIAVSADAIKRATDENGAAPLKIRRHTISGIDLGKRSRREFIRPNTTLAKRHHEPIGAGSRPAKSLLAIAATAFSLLRHRLCGPRERRHREADDDSRPAGF